MEGSLLGVTITFPEAGDDLIEAPSTISCQPTNGSVGGRRARPLSPADPDFLAFHNPCR
jgi:hypothetical protein